MTQQDTSFDCVTEQKGISYKLHTFHFMHIWHILNIILLFEGFTVSFCLVFSSVHVQFNVAGYLG